MKETAEAKREILIKLNHILIGFGLLIKGYEKSYYFAAHPLSVIFFFTAGGLIIAGTIFHKKLEHKFKNFDSLIFILEGVSLCLAALILFEKGGSKIPYILMVLSFTYLVIGISLFYSARKGDPRILLYMEKFIAALFILAGIIMLILNFLVYNSFWMYITGALFILTALFLLLFKKFSRKSSNR